MLSSICIMARNYVLSVNDAEFGFDDQGLPFLETDIIEDCHQDSEIQLLLDREVDLLREDQYLLRIIMANCEAGRAIFNLCSHKI